jgi:hypothetical protein
MVCAGIVIYIHYPPEQLWVQTELYLVVIIKQAIAMDNNNLKLL